MKKRRGGGNDNNMEVEEKEKEMIDLPLHLMAVFGDRLAVACGFLLEVRCCLSLFLFLSLCFCFFSHIFSFFLL